MKLSNMALAAAVAGLLSGGPAIAQQPISYGLYPATQSPAARQVAYEYDSYYAAAQPTPAAAEPMSPSDAYAPFADEAPVKASCCKQPCQSECGDCCDEEPWRLFDCQQLRCRGWDIGGWIDQGFTWNPDSPADRFNGVNTFNDRSNEYQLNQVYLYIDRPVDTGGCGWDLGGRMDLLWGMDYRFTTALGLDTDLDTGAPKWDSSRFYGLAMPQLYGQVGYNNLSVKVGHFYTPVGYETVTATGNFFYSHLYTHQYGEPFTHTGALANYQITDRLMLLGGIVRGWDNWEDTNDDESFIGGFTLTSADGGMSLAYAIVAGNEAPIGAAIDDQDRFYQSVVITRKVTERLTSIIHSDLGLQNDAIPFAGGSGAQDVEWYSLTKYWIYNINKCWDAGFRYEWFRDDDGFRVNGLGTNPFTPGLGVPRGGFAGTFQDISLGLNYKPNANIIVRPEVRWDWYDGLSNAAGQRPYDDGSDSSQTTLGTDIIWTY